MASIELDDCCLMLLESIVKDGSIAMMNALFLLAFIGALIGAIVLTLIFQRILNKRRLQQQGRFITWVHLVSHLEKRQGVVIYNYNLSIPGKVWWCPDSQCVKENPIPYLLATEAMLTSPPRLFRNPDALRNRYPGMTILTSSEDVFGNPA